MCVYQGLAIWNGGQQDRQNPCFNEASITVRKTDNRGVGRIVPGVLYVLKGNKAGSAERG